MEKYRFTEQERALYEGLPQPFAVYQFLDKRVVTLLLSDSFCELFGYSDRNLAYFDMDHNMYKDVHPDDVARIANAAFRFATEGGRYEVIYRTRKKDQSGYTVIHAIGRHVYTASGVRLAQVWYTDEGTYSEDGDASGTKLLTSMNRALHEESFVKANHFDYLTGLPSMTYFFELVDETRREMLLEERQPALLYMDMSGMKFFNHKHSFAEGDRVLRDFARLLVRTFHSENCCRIGADHFAVITDSAGLEDRLRQLFRDWREEGGHSALAVRVGICLNLTATTQVSSACDRAKLACDALKGAYASCFNYYSREMSEDTARRQYILENFDRALAEKWIQVYYQPLVRAVNGRVCDEEALARWIDPEKGLLPPSAFIPYLEDAELIYRLDLYVLEQTLEKMCLQERLGLHVVPHSINLSRSDFDVCDIVEEIRRRVDEAGISRGKITIEITESILGSDFDFMKSQVERFQALGFPVWMDDFGSGYSSLDVLQSIKFDLLKFDMGFMRTLDQGESGRIILTELMKMATALGVDTVCEGVETKAQVHFLQEIGCSKLQGYYYCKPIPLDAILERYREGRQIGYENPAEADYYESIGRVNLYDLGVIANEDDRSLHNTFNTLPMGILEIRGDCARFVRSNQSYRDFILRFFHFDLSQTGEAFVKYSDNFMRDVVKICCEQGLRAFCDEQMPDGSVVHSFARRIGRNPVNGNDAVAVAVLSITPPDTGATYANIARALAADYYCLYYVDLETESFIEYSSPIGGEELAIERHGENFFVQARRDALTRVYAEDRETFLGSFTKENILHALDVQGVFTATYRLIDGGKPMYVNMKIVRMRSDARHIIIGISIIDSQMQQKAHLERFLRERDMLARVMALTEDYLSLYTVDPETGRYVEYTSTSEYETLGFAKEGADFFRNAVQDAGKSLSPEDLPRFLEQFTPENIQSAIQTEGRFRLCYSLMINGTPRPVMLKVTPFQEDGRQKLLVGVRTRRDGQ